MSLRMSEEEYAELMRRRGMGSDGSASATSSDLASLGHLPQRGRLLEVDAPTEKRGKYGNRKVTVDGMKFDSRHEANYYFSVLLPRRMAGELVLLARQVPFDLPGGIRYIADFVTVDTEGRVEVIDAKSAITKKNRTYINKKKQMRAVWRIDILEV